MKKLLLTLIILAGLGSLHGMESQKQLSPISLPQTYHQLLTHYLSNEHGYSHPEITQHIFSLQLGDVNLAKFPHEIEQSCKDPHSLVQSIVILINSCGYELASKLYKQYFPQNILIYNIKDIEGYGYTALHDAAANGRTETVKLLLDVTGNSDNTWILLTMKDNGGGIALHWAARDGYTETVKLLLNAAGNNAWTLLTTKTNEGLTALHWAAQFGHIETVKLLLDTAGDNAWTLLNTKNNNGFTALHKAACNGNIEIVKLLLDTAGNKVQDLMDIQNMSGRTSFDVATPEIRKVMNKYLQNNNQ